MELAGRIGRALARRIAYARYFLFAKRDSRANLRSTSGRNVLVLCYGNIYRSPFVARQLADHLSRSGWEIRSAGFHDKEGRCCDAKFVALAAQFGIDIQSHRSRKVTKSDTGWADLIVIMDGRNRLMLRELTDDADEKVVWIGSWLDGFRPDVVDPYGTDPAQVERIVSRLYQSGDALVQELRDVSP